MIKDGTFEIASGDDGVHADTSLTVDGGSVMITKSYEGLESAAITINNGTIRVTSRDDALNAAGGNDGSALGGRPGQNNFTQGGNYFIRIAGGHIAIDAGGDGVDANGSLYFSGGTVLVNGPTNAGNGALDYDGTCEITGGILIAAGSSGMAQAPGTTSTQSSILIYYTNTQKAGTLATLTDNSGQPIIAFAPTKDYQTIVFSSPQLQQGKTYTLLSGGTADSALSDGLYTGDTGGNITGNTKLTDITLSSITTMISDNGTAVSGGMHGGPGDQGGMGGQGRPGGQAGMPMPEGQGGTPGNVPGGQNRPQRQ